MPFNQQHMLLQWSGSFRGGSATDPIQEIFSGSIRFAGPGLNEADNNQTLGALAIQLQRFWVSTAAYIPTSAFLEQVKWNRIDVEGHYASEKTRAVTLPSIQGTGSAGYPHQVSWATTWLADAARGKASKGRTFWPTGAPVDPNTGHVASTIVRNMAGASAKLIKDLTQAARTGNVDAAPNPEPAWLAALGFAAATVRDGSGMSPVIMSKIGAGTTRPIIAAGVGDRLDIQRRRGNAMTDRRTVVEVSSLA